MDFKDQKSKIYMKIYTKSLVTAFFFYPSVHDTLNTLDSACDCLWLETIQLHSHFTLHTEYIQQRIKVCR